MKSNKAVILITLACMLLAVSVYVLAYSYKERSAAPNFNQPFSHGKVAPSKAEDGTYTVRIHSILTGPEDAVLTFSHVTYFTGEEASSSAAYEADCPEEQPLEACVPTLTKGYYVRPSGAPDFSAPLTSSTRIALKDGQEADAQTFRTLDRQFEPVFDVEIRDGNIMSIVEKSPL